MPPTPAGGRLVIQDQGLHACPQQVVSGGQSRLATAYNDRFVAVVAVLCHGCDQPICKTVRSSANSAGRTRCNTVRPSRVRSSRPASVIFFR